MNNEYYNGIVEFHFEVVIKADNHHTCLNISKKIRHYLSSWSFCVDMSYESKSARKGDVLQRGIQGIAENYPSTIIAFKEGLKCICFHYNLFTQNGSVEFFDRETLPKDSRFNIFS